MQMDYECIFAASNANLGRFLSVRDGVAICQLICSLLALIDLEFSFSRLDSAP